MRKLLKMNLFVSIILLFVFNSTNNAQNNSMSERPRVREIGLKVGVLPTGKLNAITDVDSVRVGHKTITILYLRQKQ